MLHIGIRRMPFSGALRAFLARSALRRERNRLGRLDDRLLRDIGVTREQALAEASRPDWDAPTHWHQ
ncbi:MAG: DUF1127 domain-containing protein [Tabrizicola sp.]|nr:DUF1127 domain-containing protein [Tabrizicola sp.]